MRTVDRIFGWLMAAGGLLLCFLCIVEFVAHTHDRPWTPGHCLAVLLLAACNLMRAERPHDRTLARVCMGGNLAWLALLCVYAATSSSNRLSVALAVIAATLLFFSSRTRKHSRPM